MAIDHIPLVLPDTEPQKEGMGRDWHRSVIVSVILCLTGASIVLALLPARDPEVVFANTPASVVSQAALSAPPMPIIQPAGGIDALVPTASDAQTGDEVDGAANTAGETETRALPTEALLKDFQVWAAEEDARTQVKPMEAVQTLQPIEDGQAQDGQNAPVEVRPSQKTQQIESHHRAKQVRTGHTGARQLKNARAEIRPMEKHRQAQSMQKVRPKIQPVHNARSRRPLQNTQPELRPEENADATWLERTFGWLY